MADYIEKIQVGSSEAWPISATKLKNSPTFQINLASTDAVSFEGTENVTPGVMGTLPIANGGTGQTTAAGIRNALGLGNTTGALPIANGGTGATSAANALSNLGGIGVDLLWTNSSPTSSFAAQTLSLDLSGYQAIIVESVVDTTYLADAIVSLFCKIGTSGYMNSIYDVDGSGYTSAYLRKFTVSATGVTFKAGVYKYSNSSTTGTTYNPANVPVRIYGIKGVN